MEEIKIQWWGISRSRSFSVYLDSKPVVTYKLKKDIWHNSDYNIWQKFPILQSGSKLKICLRDGTEDPWEMKKMFGIRNIVINGRAGHFRNKNEKFKNLVLHHLFKERMDAETILMLEFLIEQSNTKEEDS